MILPTHIGEVIEELERIIHVSEMKGMREGYFAALYLRVTEEVRRKIRTNYFEDNQRMERLDVVFANRYLTAFDQYHRRQPCSLSWQIAFDTCKYWQPLVIQHLFAGMNAHIGLDLGIAAATVCPGESIHNLYQDFNKINMILAGLVNTVEDELSRIWPILKPIDWVAGKLEEEIAAFSMDKAREAAWKVALQYAVLTDHAQKADFVHMRDEKVSVFSKKIVAPGPLLNTTELFFRLFEHGSVKEKVEILSN